jgi:hypothetical protein
VISTDIWKHPNRFAKDVDAYLYLWIFCATKTQNEAVVEGMGSVWAASGEGVRHLELASSEKEAVIAYSGPQPWHPEAKAISLDSNHFRIGNIALFKLSAVDNYCTGILHKCLE